MDGFDHITVLKREMCEQMNLNPGDIVVDCTAGGGGHTEVMLSAVGEEGQVIAFDRDPLAINFLKEKFAKPISTENLVLIKSEFSQIRSKLDEKGLLGKVQAIGADIGVSSPQLDLDERGFSFASDAPLDMRMDTENTPVTAKEVVNEYTEKELTDIFRRYGEEPKAHFVAKAICQKREVAAIETTSELAEIVKGAIHYKTKSKKHPATKVFQALRIEVNKELDELTVLIEDGFSSLKEGGRLAVISFHSLEDKIVKKAFKKLAGKENKSSVLDRLPIQQDEVDRLKNIEGKIIKPFPLVPGDGEIDENPRARSAKLRTIEKIRA